MSSEKSPFVDFFFWKSRKFDMAPAREPFIKRIDSLLASKKKGRKDLIEAIGVNHGAISSWDRRGTVPAADVALKLADYLGVSVRWLVTGEDDRGYTQSEQNLVVKYRCLTDQGQYEVNALLDAKLKVLGENSEKIGTPAKKRSEMMTQAQFVGEAAPAYGERTIDISRYAHNDIPKDKVRFTGWDMVILPHMGKVAAGRPIEIGGFTGEGFPFPKPKLRGSEEDYFTVEIEGTSMTEAGINDGDFVVIRKAEEPRQGKIMLVKHDGDSTLKRIKIKETRNGSRMEVYLHWENGSGNFKLVDSSEYEIQGEFYLNLGK